jgi:hypothetical protein
MKQRTNSLAARGGRIVHWTSDDLAAASWQANEFHRPWGHRGPTRREVWAARFRDGGPAHPFWLYTHIPFCPQICSFCQCSSRDEGIKRLLVDSVQSSYCFRRVIVRAFHGSQIKC